MSKIMDTGWSVLIYPEGELTVGGPIKPFMPGTGLVAVEGRVPVAPLWLHIRQSGSPARFPILRRGRVEVRLGKPLTFPPAPPSRKQQQRLRRQCGVVTGEQIHFH